jgi:hypothetical protein
MIDVYVGFDEREEYGFHTFVSSLLHHASQPVRVTPIGNALCSWLGLDRQPDESTDFARIRFLIPWMHGWRGWAIFLDGSDMVIRDDIGKLYDLRDEYKALMVVDHDYETSHPMKFVGTSMATINRSYPKKNQSSVMLINCASFAWRNITPETIGRMSGAELHQFAFVPDDRIGHIPPEWNWIADEFGANEEAKVIHWTAGIPAFPAYSQSPMADEWARYALRVTHVTS